MKTITAINVGGTLIAIGQRCGLDLLTTTVRKNTDQGKDMEIMSVLKITNQNFESAVINSEKPVLLDFWASWCGPCRMVSPLVDEIAQENPQFLVGKVNVDEEPELAQKFGIMSIPTLVVMKGGKIVRQVTGARPKAQLLELLED